MTAGRDPGRTPTGPVSVVIPAYNEEGIIAGCLEALAEGAASGELEVIVVCNGCTDRTADVARRFEPAIRVLETPTGNKTLALNLGDEAATGFPRLYLDSDVVVDLDSVRAVADALRSGPLLAAAPAMQKDFSSASWAVRAYYRVWQRLPYTREGLIGVGSYAVSEAGRRRFERFPDIISDDGYVRCLFDAHERGAVPRAKAQVVAPASVRDLVRIKTRSRLGGYELGQRFPELVAREQSGKDYGGALSAVAFRPWLWPHAIVYLYVNLAARLRARSQLADLDGYTWERDDSSR